MDGKSVVATAATVTAKQAVTTTKVGRVRRLDDDKALLLLGELKSHHSGSSRHAS